MLFHNLQFKYETMKLRSIMFPGRHLRTPLRTSTVIETEIPVIDQNSLLLSSIKTAIESRKVNSRENMNHRSVFV